MSSKNRQPDPNSIFFQQVSVSESIAQTEAQMATPEPRPAERAIVYCEGHLDKASGEITHGLLRYTDKYKIVSIIDDENAGKDSGKLLNNEANEIPIFRNLGTALAQAGRTPAYCVFGYTPVDGELSELEKRVILRAIGYRMNIACSLHESLNADPELADTAAEKNVVITDV